VASSKQDSEFGLGGVGCGLCATSIMQVHISRRRFAKEMSQSSFCDTRASCLRHVVGEGGRDSIRLPYQIACVCMREYVQAQEAAMAMIGRIERMCNNPCDDHMRVSGTEGRRYDHAGPWHNLLASTLTPPSSETPIGSPLLKERKDDQNESFG